MKNDNQFISETIEIKIPFFDVDTMNITWHGHYIKYFEMARCALLDKIRFNYNDMAKTNYSWPVVDLRVKYVRPTYFQQEIRVTAMLSEYENRLKIEYLIEDKVTSEKLTEGFSIQVAVNNETKKLSFTTPEVLLRKIEEYAL